MLGARRHGVHRPNVMEETANSRRPRLQRSVRRATKGNEVLTIKPNDQENARVLSTLQTDKGRVSERTLANIRLVLHLKRESYAVAGLHMTETPCQSGAYSVVPPR